MTFHASNGTALHLKVTANGPTTLCLHGLGGGTHFFDEFAARVSDRFQVCAADLPGVGRSTEPDSVFSMEGWVETFVELLRKQFTSPITILGHSMSVILRMKRYCACPERIASLVLAGGPPEARPFIRERLARRAEHISRDGMTGLGRTVAQGNFSPRTLREQPELVAQFEKRFEALNTECC